jgi:6-phosphogluconolactonase
MLVYIGTYTRDGTSEGIYVCDFDPATGALTRRFTAANVPDPSYLALSDDGSMLYSVNEVDEGGVSAFRTSPSGELTFVNRVASHGVHPCHLSVHPSGRWVLVANYTGGTIASLPIQPDGALGEAVDVVAHTGSGPNPRRQEGPHPHMIVTDPDHEFVLVSDLGADEVLAYRLDLESGRLRAEPDRGGQLPAGAGPRHFAFGNGVYVLCELDCTLVAHEYAAGRLHQKQILSTLPRQRLDSDSTAAIVMAPSGRFVYTSNRGHDSIATFEIDATTGNLTPRGHTPSGGRTPRDFNIDPSGRWLLAENSNSDTIITFAIDPNSGQLEPTANVCSVPRPVCLRFSQ